MNLPKGISTRPLILGLSCLITIVLMQSSITYSQTVFEAFPETANNPIQDESARQQNVYRLVGKLTFNENHILPALSQIERGKINQKVDPPIIGVVRKIFEPVGIGNMESRFLNNSGYTIGGGNLLLSSDSTAVWTTHIQSTEANAVRVHLIGYLPAGCLIYVYNGRGETYGPYMSAQVTPDGFWTNTIFSHDVYIEVQIPKFAMDSIGVLSLVIPEIAHIQNESYAPKAAPHGPGCFEDVSCAYANGFSGITNLKRAVAYYNFMDGGHVYACSGGLVNDVRSVDFQPFFLTANHCFSAAAVAATVNAYFDYRTSTCDGSVPSLSGLPQALGATLIATNSVTDFTLALLQQNPGGSRLYLGWTTSLVSNGTTLHSVHHPLEYSQKYSRVTKNQPLISLCVSLSKFHFTDVVQGPTQNGSSGGVLTNANSQIVGQLFGTCGNSTNECAITAYQNVWGAFDQSFNSNNLAYWLNTSGPSTGPSPRISVSPSPIAFGSRTVGGTVDLQLTVSNTSTSSNGLNLQAGTATILGTNASEFSLVGGSNLYVPPGQSRTFTVRFSPISGGSKSATLNIPHNASNTSSPIAVSLTGTANNPSPILTSILPTGGNRLQTLNVVFTGSNFLDVVSSVNVGTGITVNSTTVNSSTQLTANLTIASSAATGDRNFSVTNAGPGGGTSSTRPFTVNNPLPTLTGIFPNSGERGFGLNVTFTGTGFISGVTQVDPVSGISVNPVTVNSSTQLTAGLVISSSATIGDRSFSVTNAGPGGGRSGYKTFTVTSPPSITQHPSNQTASTGQTATFNVTASGSTPLSYQWQKNSSNVTGATNASYTTPPT
ncbi:MAG: choice-of-anchor D domain-containing protein, partial [Ignavibacteriae bacterium]|nr:choice-of-anchor D domain-containing protein [Ignavibacteriota bacterium]